VSSIYPDSVPASDHSRWFAEEVQPYEPALRAYLHGQFPSLVDQDDIVQDAYSRLLRARQTGEIRHPKAFLFTIARNVALDVFRRNRTVSIDDIADAGEFAVFDDDAGVAEAVSRKQELALLAEAINSLPRRCRRVLKLRKIYGLSHKEIAARLGISERTVGVQVGKGIRRCVEFMQSRGVMMPRNATFSPNADAP
jgi:RNA polymerase sigma-70 factor (ECF subfamily)